MNREPTKQNHIIYIPGLGDDDVRLQQRVVHSWRWWGVNAEILQMHWQDNEKWPKKMDRIVNRIDELTRQGKRIHIVGVSAGASAAINTFAAQAQSIMGCVLIAGKINRPGSIGNKYRNENPAFVESVYECQKSLVQLDDSQKRNILSLYAIKDELISKHDSIVSGSHNLTVPMVGHVPTIATAITVGAPFFIRFLKKL